MIQPLASWMIATNQTRRRILIVEDEFLIAKDIEAAFARMGLEVVGIAQNLDRAMQLARTSEPLDGAVLDIDLSGEIAFPVADLLQDRGVPFVFATGIETNGVPQKYEGIAKYHKPLNLLAIVAKLSE